VKAYSFRLAGVARVRQLEEGIAAQELATAARAVALAQRDVARATRQLGELAAPTGATSVHDVRWTEDQADRLSESRRAHLAALEAAETQRAVARDRWLVSRRRCAVLERLDDRRRGEWQTEFDRSEAKELDDMASVGGPGTPAVAGGAGW
jgi:flagellar export protein FliJ